MIRSLSICLMLGALTALILPGVARTQTPEIDAEVRLNLLEARLQALLAEIKAMHAAPATPTAKGKVEEKKPQQFKVVVDGDQVLIFDATGRIMSATEAGPNLKVMQADDGKAGEKKIIVRADGTVRSLCDAKVEKKYAVVDDGKKSSGETKVQGKVVVVEDGKTPAGDAKTEKKVVVMSDAKGGTVDPKTAAILRVAVEDSMAKGGLRIVAAPVQVHPSKVETGWTTAFAFATNSSTETVTLSRTTYTLPAAKAAALEAFLKENAKVKVLETKRDGDKLTVTTTPDVQSTIGGLIALMSGQSSTVDGRPAKVIFSTPLAPTAPDKPKKPE